MNDIENKKALDESINYFDSFVNEVLSKGLDGFEPMEVVKNYNVLRTELSKLYVDI